jgi:DNA mismatch repair ATPase MutS
LGYVVYQSYGMNVANMAGIVRHVVDRADHKATEFEAANHLGDVAATQRVISKNALANFALLVQRGRRSCASGTGQDSRVDTIKMRTLVKSVYGLKVTP